MSDETKQEESQETIALKRDDKGRLVKGTPPGPGRPKGSKSIKEMVREYLDEHPDDMKAFVDHFVKKNRDLAWQMLEGRPQQDITSMGEKIVPIPILNVPTNDSNKEDSKPQEENQSSAGGNISKQDDINNLVADSSGTV